MSIPNPSFLLGLFHFEPHAMQFREENVLIPHGTYSPKRILEKKTQKDDCHAMKSLENEDFHVSKSSSF